MTGSGHVMYEATVRSLPFADQCRAAAIAECDALTISPTTYRDLAEEGLAAPEMKAIAAGHGVAITHLDPIARWTPHWEPVNYRGMFDFALLGCELSDFLSIADVLGCRSFTALGTHPAGSVGIAELVDHFGMLCARAAAEGLRVDLEFIPFFGIATLDEAWQIVSGANAPNSGLMLDIWHYRRSHGADELLRSIPGNRITGVQLNDGDAELPPGVSMIEDCLSRRRPPGQGAFRVPDIVALLRETGGLNNVGPEIFSADFADLSAETIGEICRDSVASVLA